MKPSPRLIPLHSDSGTDLSPDEQAAVTVALDGQCDQSALLPILHAVQDALGYVPSAAVPLIAHQLNLSRAEVHGVVSFYHWFRQQPPGQHVLHLCRAEACQTVGGRALEAHVMRTLAVEFGQTSADGAVTLEPVYCLGNCALGPSLMVDGALHGRVTASRFDQLLRQLRDDADEAAAP